MMRRQDDAPKVVPTTFDNFRQLSAHRQVVEHSTEGSVDATLTVSAVKPFCSVWGPLG